MTSETSARGNTWASWMDDRTTTAYSPQAHKLVGRAPAVPAPRAGSETGARRTQNTMLRMAPVAPASTRSDEAGLMWLDEADLLSVVEPSFTAADSGSVVGKCVLPCIGLFAAVLFGHIILAASGQPGGAVTGPRSEQHETDTAKAGQDERKEQRTQPAGAAAISSERSAAEGSGAQQNVGTAAQGAVAVEPANAAAREKRDRSHWQHSDEGAHGPGASAVASSVSSDSHAGPPAVSQQPGLLRVNSRPWAQVTLDGTPLGNTPLFDVHVTPGSHTLRLDNPDFQVSKTIRVDVAPGETVTRVVALQE